MKVKGTIVLQSKQSSIQKCKMSQRMDTPGAFQSNSGNGHVNDITLPFATKIHEQSTDLRSKG